VYKRQELGSIIVTAGCVHSREHSDWHVRGLVERAPPNGRRRGVKKYRGILRIGFKLLVNDKGKFSALLIGITFSK